MSSELPESWSYQLLESLCERVSVGHVGETSSFFTELDGIPFIRSQNVRPNKVDFAEIKFITKDFHRKSKKSQLQGGDLLIVRVGQNRGDCAVLPHGLGEVNCANIVFARPNPSYSDFLGAYFNTPSGHEALLSLSSGSAQLVLNTKAIAKIEVPVPPAKVAEEIGALSKKFDDRITLLRETNTTLEAIAQALFKSWFVDFDPVHAKMQGRAPEGMDQATAALFPDSFEDSELGAVPNGWRSGCLGDVAKTFKKAMAPTDLHAGVNYIGLEHIPRKSLALTDWGDAAELESNKAAFNEGDILFGKLRPYFHKVVVAPTAGVCSTDILVCQPTQAEHRGLATMYLFSEALISYADRLSNGAKMPRVNWSDLAKFPIPVPSLEVSGAYTVAVEPLLSQITQNTHTARTLATLRDTLLPRLISGQLRINFRSVKGGDHAE